MEDNEIVRLEEDLYDELILEVNPDHDSAYSEHSFSGGMWVPIVGLAMVVCMFFCSFVTHMKVQIPEVLEDYLYQQLIGDSRYYTKVGHIDRARAKQTKELELDFSHIEEKARYNDLDYSDVSLEFLDDFSRLKALCLEVDTYSMGFLKTMPELQSLEKLTLKFSSFDVELKEDDLQFFENFPNLKHLVLDESGSSVFPGYFVEKYCPQLEILELNCTQNYKGGFNFHFSKFPNLKELSFVDVASSSPVNERLEEFTASFSRKDYQKLIDRGVQVNIDGYSMDRLDESWQVYENYYEKLNLDICATPTEIIDTISLCFIEDGNFGINEFQALLHMSGMNSIFGCNYDRETGDRSNYLLVDVFGENNYYYFDFWNYSYDDLIVAINEGNSLDMPGYMVPIESMRGYTNYSYPDDFIFADSRGKSK